MDEGVTLDTLGAKPLVGFALDATHLYNVLAALTKSVDKANAGVNGVARRLSTVEANTERCVQGLEALAQRVARIERDAGGGPEDLRALKAMMSELRSVLERHDQEIPELARRTGDAAGAINQTNRVVDGLHKDIQKEFSNSQAVMKQQGDQLRGMTQQVTERGLDSDRVKQQVIATIDQMQKDFGLRVEHTLEESNRRTMSVLDDLNKKTLENFRTTDIDIRKIDDHCNALANELANIRADVNTVDNDARHNVTKLRDDNDMKFAELLSALQGIEQGSALMERQLAEAGRVLNQRATFRQGTGTTQDPAPPRQLLGGGGPQTTFTTNTKWTM